MPPTRPFDTVVKITIDEKDGEQINDFLVKLDLDEELEEDEEEEVMEKIHRMMHRELSITYTYEWMHENNMYDTELTVGAVQFDEFLNVQDYEMEIQDGP